MFNPDAYKNAVAETAEFLRELFSKYEPDTATLVLGIVTAQHLGEYPAGVQNQFLVGFFGDSAHPVTPDVMTLISTEPT